MEARQHGIRWKLIMVCLVQAQLLRSREIDFPFGPPRTLRFERRAGINRVLPADSALSTILAYDIPVQVSVNFNFGLACQ